MATQFTDQNVKELIASGKPVVIDCWATWCGPCVRMSPIIDELAEQFGDKAVIGKYNIDEQSDLTAEHRIMSIPTILFFKEGKLVDRLAYHSPSRHSRIKSTPSSANNLPFSNRIQEPGNCRALVIYPNGAVGQESCRFNSHFFRDVLVLCLIT